MKKLILSIFCVFLMQYAFGASYDFEVDGIYYYTMGSDEVAVTEGDDPYFGEFVIPATVEHDGNVYTVVKIGRRAFYSNNNVTSIQLPETIRDVEDEAFGWCRGLTHMNIPQGIEKIGEGAFAFTKMEEFKVPDAITYLPKRSLMGLGAKRLILSSNLESLGEQALCNMDNLEELILPETLERVAIGNFDYMSALRTLHLPKNIYLARPDMSSIIAACPNLESITVDPENNHYTSIDGVLFDKSCERLLRFPSSTPLREFVMPEQTHYFTADAMSEVKNLEILTIPHGYGRELTSYTAVDLKELNFGKDVDIDLYWAPGIYMGEKLMRINVDGDNPDLCSVDGILYSKDKSVIYRYPAAKSGWEFTLGEGVDRIEMYAFSNLKNLKKLSIPNDVDEVKYRGICSSSIVFADLTGVKRVKEVGIWLDNPECVAYFSDNLELSEAKSLWIADASEIYLKVSSVPRCVEYGVSKYDFCSSDVVIYIPNGMIDAFYDSNWRAVRNLFREIDMAGIAPINGIADDVTVSYEAGAMVISGTSAVGATISVFNMSGMNVYRGNMDSCGMCEISLDKGIYLLCVGDKKMKVAL